MKSPVELLRSHLCDDDRYLSNVELFIKHTMDDYTKSFIRNNGMGTIILHMLLYNTETDTYAKSFTPWPITCDRDKEIIVYSIQRLFLGKIHPEYPVAIILSCEAYSSMYAGGTEEEREEAIRMHRELRSSEDPFRTEVIIHTFESIYDVQDIITYEVVREVKNDESSKVIELKEYFKDEFGENSRQIGGNFVNICNRAIKLYEQMIEDGISFPTIEFSKRKDESK